jgi:hypothetical protein
MKEPSWKREGEEMWIFKIIIISMMGVLLEVWPESSLVVPSSRWEGNIKTDLMYIVHERVKCIKLPQ